ncbi:MAG: 5-methyltetrahydrofolate--homocysteine methyltransferase [Gammaproteobacteria bacterium]|nr:5-methyltetrahydrofolate--homocysteine methyltransferase [Gammaproteobacteria bacterium]
MSDNQKKLIEMIVGMQSPEAIELTKVMLEEGADPNTILDICRKAMDSVGQKFEAGEYFVPELILAGDMLERISELVKPLLKEGGGGQKKTHGKVLIGTVAGDLHDIGKNIVTFMLDVNGFEVKDIGIDVPVATFIKEIQDFQPAVVGLSGFLTLAYDAMKETVEAIKTAGLRDNMKIMIGGGQVDQVICDYTGADGFGLNAMHAVKFCKEWFGVKE